jgi:hypothetical protein
VEEGESTSDRLRELLKAKLIMDMMGGGGGGQMQMQASMQGGGFPQQQFQQQQQFQNVPRGIPQQGMRGTGMAPWGGGAGAMVAAGGSLRRQANTGNFGNVGSFGNYGNSSADIVWRRQSQNEELKAMLMQRLQGGAGGGGDMSAVMAQLSGGGGGMGGADGETAMQQMLMMKMMRGLSDGGDDIRSQLIKGLMKSAVSGEKFDMTKVITPFEHHLTSNLIRI